ncbi:hypothetical protein ACKXGF_14370 (plasmid) [Alkalibacillus sp. S2W]|uniref:hypothetical protein n=1 Tax=Alkalibacillus sp. S2W TaxID=3386553 RepID=UPI00398D5A5A
MIMKLFKQEMKYGFSSKLFYTITIFLVFFFTLVLYLNYSAVNDAYDQFLNTKEYYEQNDLDIEKDLEGESEVIEETKDGGVINNPILHHKEQVSKFIYTASPEYSLSQLLESSLLYFPIVFGILGLLLATTDFRYKTIKIKTVRNNKVHLDIAKQISLAVSGLFIMLIALITSYLLSLFFYYKISNTIPITEFEMNLQPINSSSPLLLKFAFAYGISLIFMIIGYTLGIVFKNIYVGMISIIVYMFVLPNLGVFDLKNSLYFIGNKIFDFKGVIAVENANDNTTVLTSMSVFLSVLIISFAINILIMKKRSSFEN